MIATVILILLACLFAGSIESNLMEAFSDPEWMNMEEKQRRYLCAKETEATAEVWL